MNFEEDKDTIDVKEVFMFGVVWKVDSESRRIDDLT